MRLYLCCLIFALLLGASLGRDVNVIAPVTLEPTECVLTDWNVIALANFSSGNTDTEGRIAANIGNFGVAGQSYTSTMKYPVISNASRYDVLANLGLWGSSGMNFGGGNAVYQNPSSNYNGLTLAGNGARIRRDTDPWFALAHRQIRDASERLSQMATTGTVSNYYNTLTLTGNAAHVNVFVIEPATFAACVGLYLHVPAGSTAIINIPGQEITTGSYQMFWQCGSFQVVFNLYQAVTVTNSLSWMGTILAPYATFNTGWGQINGGVFVNNYNGPTQNNWCPYAGLVPLCTHYSTDCVQPLNSWCTAKSWPIDSATTFCGKTWIQIARAKAGSNAWMQLAQQYVAARLNIQQGASATYAVQSLMVDALSFINQCKDNPTGSTKALALGYAGALLNYNSGLAGTARC